MRLHKTSNLIHSPTMNLKTATSFVVLMGLTSLFSDMTYEGARSINGAYLDILGASATTVGFVAGLGELAGYGLRIISGYISDKTRKYWTITIAGYFLNLFSVPLLAFAGYWQIAIILIIVERVGKAIRTPARDAMLSYATKKMGRGWGFGLHEALDSVGATIGPLIISAVLYFKQDSFKTAYLLLVIPALLAISVLLFSWKLHPSPESLEIKITTIKTTGYTKKFWIYLIASACIAAGFADFTLIAYHFKSSGIMQDATIPILYSLAMASEGLAALISGKLFDHYGNRVIICLTLISLLFAPMVFMGGFSWAIAGMILWGIGMGAQESVLKAAVSEFIPHQKRGTGFGLFNSVFGLSWFFGSFLMGFLYDKSISWLVIFSICTQLMAILIFWLGFRKRVSKL